MIVTICTNARLKNNIGSFKRVMEANNPGVAFLTPELLRFTEEPTERDLEMLKTIHKEKIRCSIGIVVFHDGSIDESLKEEIEYAKELKLNILYIDVRDGKESYTL